jgi:hypothetical protein
LRSPFQGICTRYLFQKNKNVQISTVSDISIHFHHHPGTVMSSPTRPLTDVATLFHSRSCISGCSWDTGNISTVGIRKIVVEFVWQLGHHIPLFLMCLRMSDDHSALCHGTPTCGSCGFSRTGSVVWNVWICLKTWGPSNFIRSTKKVSGFQQSLGFHTLGHIHVITKLQRKCLQTNRWVQC